MQTLLVVFHMMLSVGLISLILIQHGKGADMGAAFGSGASATVFGARGSGSFLSRTTAILATLFFLTSMALAYFAAQVTEPVSVMDKVEPREVEQPAPPESEVPLPPGAQAPAQLEVPVPQETAVPVAPGQTMPEGPAESAVPAPPEQSAPEAPVESAVPAAPAQSEAPAGGSEATSAVEIPGQTQGGGSPVDTGLEAVAPSPVEPANAKTEEQPPQ